MTSNYRPAKEQAIIFETFYRFDKDGSGSIDFEEFCKNFDFKPNRFAKRAFMLLDTGGTGEITFVQFVVACWNYCTYDKMGLYNFAYMLYDDKRTRNIPTEQMFILLEEVYDFKSRGKTFDSSGTYNVVKNSPEYYVIQAKRGLKACAGADDLISFEEFIGYGRSHPNLLALPFGLQYTLQKRLGGAKFWKEMTDKRRRMERAAGTSGLNMLDVKVVVDWLERETGADLTSAHGRRRKSRNSNAVKHGSGSIGGRKRRPSRIDTNNLNEGDGRNKLIDDAPQTPKQKQKRKSALKRMNSARLIQKVARKAVVQKKKREGRLHPHQRKIDGEWIERKDTRKGKVFYYNRVTGEKTTDASKLPESWRKQRKKSSSAEAPLPKGWRELRDKKNGHSYYYNKITKEKSWDRPS